MAKHSSKRCTLTTQTITFPDYDGEWLIPVRMAAQNGEPLPLLLCEFSSWECYDIWDNIRYEYIEGRPWYLPFTSKLALRSSFMVNDTAYRLLAVTDLDAYHQLWSCISTNEFISLHLFSGLIEPSAIEAFLFKNQYFYMDATRAQQFGNWVYWTRFGGGADEHFGSFYAQDQQLTEQFQAWLAPEQRLARFAGLHGCIFMPEYGSPDDLIPLKLANHYHESPPLLLCQIDQQLCYNTYSLELHEHVPDTVWYKTYMDHLPLIDRFSQNNVEYRILAITQQDAYQRLWESELGTTPIVRAVLSADCDLVRLKHLLCQPDFYLMPEALENLGSWAYSPHGSLRIFHAQDPQITQFVEALQHEMMQEAKKR